MEETQKQYMDYIPIIFENHILNAIVMTTIPALFYILASYAHLYYKDCTLSSAIIISIFFAIFEYIVRVPIIKYSSDVAGLSNFWLQVIWISITLVLAFGSDYVTPSHEPKIIDSIDVID
jgi:uncharacterized protein (DUF486 family)